MKETTASFSSTSAVSNSISSSGISQELLKLSENIHYLLGYQAAFFDKGMRFRAPSSQEAKQASRFLDELKKSSSFVRTLFQTEPSIGSVRLENRIREYIEERTLAAKGDSGLLCAVVDVGERLLGFTQEIKRRAKQEEKLAA